MKRHAMRRTSLKYNIHKDTFATQSVFFLGKVGGNDEDQITLQKDTVTAHEMGLRDHSLRG